VTAESHLTSVTVHPGKVSDTSFIPAEAESFCFNGYQWITIGQQTAKSGHGKKLSTYLILKVLWHAFAL